ncbi:MAG: metalloprotease, partial [Flavobacteriaceae bacterium]|nr:metalloprotease [Flavobacteriaceae bacterium]
PTISALSIDRIVHFLDEKLGPYPHDKMMITKTAYKKNPVYGLNQLPSFISPFPDGFEYNMEQLKTISRTYIENTLAVNPREDHWLIGALQIYIMMEYVDRYYPKMKIIGNLSELWVIRWSHISKLEFNDQYPLLYLNMARSNLQQSLTTPRDSLVKFNKNIASDYYGGDGLQYLSDYLGRETVEKTIKEFYKDQRLKPVKASVFQKYLENNTELPVNWFFENYLNSRSTIDFKIKKVVKREDSLDVTIKNKRNHPLPVSIYGLNNDNVVFKKWTEPIDSLITITVPSENIEKLALNHETIIPEFNQRNNYKKINGLLNRPIQFRLFQDVEDPKYNQLFFMPVFQYNLYDGVSLGLKLYNKTLLRKSIHYKLEPQYGFNSKTLVGKGSVSYRQQYEEGNLNSFRFGVAGSYFSYNTDLFYKRLSPFMTFSFRNKDLRDNEKQFINLRSVNVFRDQDVNDLDQEPNYSVFNLQYVYSNPNLINYFRGVFDTQFSSDFSKISTTLEYRKLFLNNRQLNIRFFAGAFLHNRTKQDGDFFSFALDRPTDYLFDYSYYGRSEESGLFSQQIIVAEGGFKSQLEPAFSNNWMATVNASTNIWNWIYAYGDAGLVHNKNEKTKAVYDSGIRLSLVADYFELFFPLYSNLGWEPGLPNYDQRIRFIVTLDPKTLLGLFTREWY